MSDCKSGWTLRADRVEEADRLSRARETACEAQPTEGNDRCNACWQSVSWTDNCTMLHEERIRFSQPARCTVLRMHRAGVREQERMRVLSRHHLHHSDVRDAFPFASHPIAIFWSFHARINFTNAATDIASD